jgi:hypothetical protein
MQPVIYSNKNISWVAECLIGPQGEMCSLGLVGYLNNLYGMVTALQYICTLLSVVVSICYISAPLTRWPGGMHIKLH